MISPAHRIAPLLQPQPYRQPLPASSPDIVHGGGAATPLLQLTGVTAGRTYAIAKGSLVGVHSPTGTAQVERLDADGASFLLDARATGGRAHVRMTVKRSPDGRVLISTQDLLSGRMRTGVGKVLSAHPGVSQFQSADGRERTTIRQAGGQLIIDTRLPQLGAAHIVLQ